MSKSLKRHNLPKLIQEEINNMNKPIYVKEIEFVEESFLQRSIRTLCDIESVQNVVFDLHFQIVLYRKALWLLPLPSAASFFLLEVYRFTARAWLLLQVLRWSPYSERTLLFLWNYWLSKPLSSLQIMTVLAHDFSDIWCLWLEKITYLTRRVNWWLWASVCALCFIF